MGSIILRRVGCLSRFFTLLVLVTVVSVALPRPCLAQGTQVQAQQQDLGATDASQAVTVSLVLKVKHPELLEAYVASTQDPYSRTYHRFLSLPGFVFNFAPSSLKSLSSRSISSCSIFR
jgi:subtilase family serine protease